MNKNKDIELFKAIAEKMNLDPDIISEDDVTSKSAAKALEQSYNRRIKMGETRVKLAEKDVKDMKKLFKRIVDQLKIYNLALQRDEKSFDSIAEIFEQLGYAKYSTQCREKAAYIRDMLARHRAFLTHIKTLIDTIVPGRK